MRIAQDYLVSPKYRYHSENFKYPLSSYPMGDIRENKTSGQFKGTASCNFDTNFVYSPSFKSNSEDWFTRITKQIKVIFDLKERFKDLPFETELSDVHSKKLLVANLKPHDIKYISKQLAMDLYNEFKTEKQYTKGFIDFLSSVIVLYDKSIRTYTKDEIKEVINKLV